MNKRKYQWHKVLEDPNELPENRVMTVTAGHYTFCLTNVKGQLSCLDNKCPHQGGPLGEGSIENGLLRCPWHGWDYDPITGKAPGFDDGVETFPLEIRDDGVYIGIEEEQPHQATITDVMVETMVNWGVNTIFGMVGHSNLGLADALRRQEKKGTLNFYGIRHEGAASFAASAYGKLTGKPAACFTIAGPGATNLYTGLWDAKVDRAPILALTGQVDTQVMGTGNFQELDLVRAFDSVAVFNHRVESGSRHSELMLLAIKNAILRRDVSHLTFPDEIQTLPSEKNNAKTPKGRITPLTIAPPKEQLDKAVELIKNAKQPMIIVGHGAKFSMDGIITFAEKLKCPVATTFKGKGQISDHHPLAAGVLGRSGTPIASYFMNECDLLIVFGASFSKHTGITSKKPIIQVDFDALALSKFHQVEVPVWGEIGVTVDLLKEEISGEIKSEDQTKYIAKRWAIWRSEKAKRLLDNRGKGVSSIAVFDAMNKTAPKDAVMCVDVGNNAYSFGRYYESKSNNTFLMSGYLGSIGFAYPAAIGAWAATKGDRPIVAVAGDGGFGQYMAEINTAVLYNMPIKLILLNNSELGKISKEQRAGEFDVWKTKLSNPNFSEFAEACGAKGWRVTKKEDLIVAMEALFAHQGPGLLEVVTDVKLL